MWKNFNTLKFILPALCFISFVYQSNCFPINHIHDYHQQKLEHSANSKSGYDITESDKKFEDENVVDVSFHESWHKIKNISLEDTKCLSSDVKKYCTEDMAEIKETLTKAIKNNCADCSFRQKLSAGKVAALLIYQYPEAWKTMLRKHNALDKFLTYFPSSN